MYYYYYVLLLLLVLCIIIISIISIIISIIIMYYYVLLYIIIMYYYYVLFILLLLLCIIYIIIILLLLLLLLFILFILFIYIYIYIYMSTYSIIITIVLAVFIIALITGGLIIWFKFKKDETILIDSGKVYGTMIIPNCAIIPYDITCTEILDIGSSPHTFIFKKNIEKNEREEKDMIYSIKLVAIFLKYLVDKVPFIIPGLYNQVLFTCSIDTNPIGFCMTNSKKTKITFIFRGSQTVADVKADLSYNYYNVTNPSFDPSTIHIHKYFEILYNEMKQTLYNSISPTVTHIDIIGHSMGAGLGFILAQDISSNSKYTVNVIGFAPPRIGNIAFIDSLKSQCSYVLSVINMADAVPTMPWSYMPNPISPYTPPQFVLILPCISFYNLAPSIAACHQPITYFNGIKYGPYTKLI